MPGPRRPQGLRDEKDIDFCNIGHEGANYNGDLPMHLCRKRSLVRREVFCSRTAETREWRLGVEDRFAVVVQHL